MVNTNKIWMLYLLGGLICYSFGEYYSKIYTNTQSKWIMVLVLFIYMIGTVMWLGILRHNNQLGLMSTVWSMFALLMGVFLGVVVFKETLTTTQWIGVVLSIISTYLLIK